MVSGHLLNSSHDFYWYKKGLDLLNKHSHDHRGQPERFPCQVISTWEYNENGADFYTHTFVYQQEISCESCGHKTFVWPNQAE